MTHAVFEAANLAIVLGYLVLALYLAPRLDVRYKRTKMGGAFFFALCAATHLGLTVRTHYGWEFDGDHPAWLAVHILQAFAVWLFIDGLYREYVDRRTAHRMWVDPPPAEK